MDESHTLEPFATVTVPMPTTDLTSKAQDALTRLRAFTIETDEHYENASRLLQEVKGLRGEIDGNRKTMKRPVDLVVQAIQAYHAPSLGLCDQAEQTLKQKMAGYLDAKEAERKRLQRIADDEAAEVRRKLQVQADKAAAKGNDQKAATLQERAATVVSAIVGDTPPKVAGQSIRKLYKFRITDARLIPREYCCPDEAKLTKFASMMREEAQLPGVQFYTETSIASRKAP
jgi:hypothetical protein